MRDEEPKLELIKEIPIMDLPDIGPTGDCRVILVHLEDWPVVQVWREAA